MRAAVVWLKTMVVVVVTAAMLTCVMCRDPVRHRVGDRAFWKPDVNYTDWSLQQVFYVGDWLYFIYDVRMYNVLQVNETSYENCNDQDFIFNITKKAGRDVFELTEPKPYYFLSGGGYCYSGMKLAVNVVEFVPPAAAAQPSLVSSGGYMTTAISHLIISSIFIVTVWAIFI